MPWAIAGAAGQLGSSIIGASELANSRDQAYNLIQQSIQDYEAMGLPTEEAMKLSLERYKSAGIVTPELEQDILQGATEMGGIQTDPRLKEAQMNALMELQSVGQGGYRLSDKAATEKILSDIAQQERGARGAIEQDMLQRGTFGGGAELASKLASQQAAAQNAYSQGLNLNAQAQDRALQAIMQGGDLARGMQGQEFSQQARIKEAQDAINRMNTAARQDVQQRNIAARNMAQQQNLANQQNIMNANVDLSNKEQTYNRGLAQQRFENQMALNQAKAGARAGQATNVQGAGKDVANLWGGLGSGLGKTGMVLQNYQSNKPASQSGPRTPGSDPEDYNWSRG